MSKITTKVLGVVAALTLVVGVSVPAASALTTAELIDILVAAGLISADDADAAVTAVSGTDSCSLKTSSDLTVGSTGANVTALQNYLIGMGYSIPAGATGYFGSQTQAALAAYQAAKAISPAVGYFGPITRSSIVCDSSSSTSTGVDGLSGAAGSVEAYELIAKYENEEVGVDEDDVVVYGLEVEAADESDIEIMAVKLDFAQGTAANDDFEDYFSNVSVWLDGDKVAEVDADEFTEDNGYAKTLSLDSGAVIEAGEKGELLVALSGVSNADSADEGDTWTLDATSVRFRDAQGTVISEDPGTAVRTFSLEAFADSANVELKITEDSDEPINKARLINIHATDETDDVEVLVFNAEVEGTSDLDVDDVVVEFVVTGAAQLDEMVSTIYLYMDGELVGTENVPTDEETVTFDDLDLVLEAGDTVEFVVKADFLGISGAIDAGDTIYAQVTDTETDLWDVEDEAGEDLVDADKTGTAAGEASAVYDVTFDVASDGWSVVSVASSDTSGIDEAVTYEIDLDITAVDGDVYIEGACTEDNDALSAAATGFNFSVLNNADFTASCNVTTGAGAGATADYKVQEGETETFTLTVSVAATTASDFAQVTLEGINWSEADEAGDIMFEGALDDDYKSTSVFINNR